MAKAKTSGCPPPNKLVRKNGSFKCVKPQKKQSGFAKFLNKRSKKSKSKRRCKYGVSKRKSKTGRKKCLKSKRRSKKRSGKKKSKKRSYKKKYGQKKMGNLSTAFCVKDLHDMESKHDPAKLKRFLQSTKNLNMARSPALKKYHKEIVKQVKKSRSPVLKRDPDMYKLLF